MWLIDNVLSLAPELLNPEVSTWECVSSIAIDCLKPLMNSSGQAPFPPEKPDRRSLLKFARLMLKDVVNGPQTDRVDEQGDAEGSNECHP
jgi:hypothetical protein